MRHSFALLAVLFVGCSSSVTAPCANSTDCTGGTTCVDGRCVARSDSGPRPDLGRGSMDASSVDAGAMCTGVVSCRGACCAAGESCVAGACCAPSSICEGACCGADQRCELGACRLACAPDRAACGAAGAERCCATGEVCLADACVMPGAACSATQRCGATEYCETTLGRCLPRVMTETCEVRPPPGVFDPRSEWSWTGDPTVVPTHDQIMMAPAVAQLTDDDSNGAIDENDVPDVVFNTFNRAGQYYTDGVLRAVSGADGSRIFPTADPAYRTMPGASVAIAELDASSVGPEILTCAQKVGGTTCCDGAAGDLLMLSARGALLRRFPTVRCGYSAPYVGDMNGDGTPELGVRYHVVHADGGEVFNVAARDTTATIADGDFNTLADVDEDGDLDLVGGQGVYRIDGTQMWTTTGNAGYPAVADLDMDGRPEIVWTRGPTHDLFAVNAEDGTPVWAAPVDINQGRPTPDGPNGGGPPTIADFDGDGLPEVAAAGGYAYGVYEGESGVAKWAATTQDRSSRVTGSSVFDFDGDGAAEVVYNDEKFLRVYRGRDGMVLLERCSTNGTLWEYPLIVDVDNDARAEILVGSNNYGGQRCADGSPSANGLSVIGSAANNWVRTRRVWSQHTYHVTDIGEDTRVPTAERRNWEVPGLNNFRQNVQPDGLFDAADLVLLDARLEPNCANTPALAVRVTNRGRAGAPSGVPVVVYATDPSMGSSMVIAMGATTRALLPGESEVLRIAIPGRVMAGQGASFWLRVNGGDMPNARLVECRPDNNTVRVDVFCPSLG